MQQEERKRLEKTVAAKVAPAICTGCAAAPMPAPQTPLPCVEIVQTTTRKRWAAAQKLRIVEESV